MIGDAKTRKTCTTAETAESSSGAAELAAERRFNRPTAPKAPTYFYSFPGDPVIPDAKVFMKGKVGLAMRYYTDLCKGSVTTESCKSDHLITKLINHQPSSSLPLLAYYPSEQLHPVQYTHTHTHIKLYSYTEYTDPNNCTTCSYYIHTSCIQREYRLYTVGQHLPSNTGAQKHRPSLPPSA